MWPKFFILMCFASYTFSSPLPSCEKCLRRSGTWAVTESGEGACVMWGQKFPIGRLQLIKPWSSCPVLTTTISAMTTNNPILIPSYPTPATSEIEEISKIIWLCVSSESFYFVFAWFMMIWLIFKNIYKFVVCLLCSWSSSSGIGSHFRDDPVLHSLENPSCSSNWRYSTRGRKVNRSFGTSCFQNRRQDHFIIPCSSHTSHSKSGPQYFKSERTAEWWSWRKFSRKGMPKRWVCTRLV